MRQMVSLQYAEGISFKRSDFMNAYRIIWKDTPGETNCGCMMCEIRYASSQTDSISIVRLTVNSRLGMSLESMLPFETLATQAPQIPPSGMNKERDVTFTPDIRYI